MVYLDNASTSFFKPRCVKRIVKKGLKLYTGNASRSGHKVALRAGEEVAKVRELFANTFNCSFNRVIFTSGCTESLNLAIRGSIKKGGHIIATVYEHNSVLRVLYELQKQGLITYSIAYPNTKGQITTLEIDKCLKPNTYMIIVNHISNVVGVKQDIYSIGQYAKKHKILFLVDGAQSVGHEIIDMKKNNISMLAIASHKGLCGMQGVGALCVSDDVKLVPIKYGGTGTFSEQLEQPKDFPEGFESGTFSALNIIAMGAGLKFVYKNLILINGKILKLSKYLHRKLAENNNIVLYSLHNLQSGVIAFNIKGKSCQQVASLLDDKYNIALRSGYACAPLVQKYLKTESFGGVVRVSIGYKNSLKDIRALVKAVNKISNQ